MVLILNEKQEAALREALHQFTENERDAEEFGGESKYLEAANGLMELFDARLAQLVER